MQSVVGLSVIAKCMPLNDLDWLFRAKFSFRAGLAEWDRATSENRKGSSNDSGVIETSIFSGFVRYASGTLGIKVISNLGAIFPRFRDIAGFRLKPATQPSIPP